MWNFKKTSMCLGTSAHGTSMQEMPILDLNEAIVKWQDTPQKSWPQLEESLLSIRSTPLTKRLNLTVSKDSQSAMAHNALYSSNGLLLKVTIE